MASLPTSAKPQRTGIGVMALLLFVVLSVLLCGDYLPANIMFSNDGPLGRLMAECHRLPARFTGCWEDLNLLGFRNWGTAPSISYGLQYLLKPFLFSKLYAPVGLFILGLGAWCFFRQSGLTPAACLLGGLAVTLSSGFFSAACWGVAAHPITVGMIFFALAALADTSSSRRWLRVALAGLAVGMGITEGADVGALFSVYVGAFVIYQAWTVEGPRVKNLAVGVGRLALVAVCAALLAAQAIFGLVATEIEGVKGTEQDAQTREGRWDWATQWSLPKWETLSFAVPGLFGYRMDTPAGGEYWGAVGRHPAWDRYFKNGKQGPPPKGLLRFSGGGPYVGVPVLLLAVWAGVQCLRRKDSAFSLLQRKLLWFWLGVGLISLLLAYGRFAPFYRVLYALPYSSTVRNPVKFIQVLAFSLVVLFAYGVDGLWRRYLQPAGPNTAPRWAGLKGWWAKATKFDKCWGRGCVLTLAASLLAWIAYASSRQSLEQYLQAVQFDEAKAHAIAGFSIGQVGWFVLFFVLAAGLMLLILSGGFAGARAKWGAGLLGLLLVADLGRANQPWIIYWDYNAKYASNPIIDRLREKPYEQRVAMLPFAAPPQFALLGRLYNGQWLKHQFQYYNVQSLDTVQVPRMPEDLSAFEKVFTTPGAKGGVLRVTMRAWQLTNTRYLLGAAGFLPSLNKQSDPAHPSFRLAERFNLVPRALPTSAPGSDQLTAVPAADGAYALIEFTEALPRAKLYSNWQVITNDQAVLDQLAAASFDPQRSVFVAGGLSAAPAATGTNDNAGKVEFASYAPKDILLRSDGPAPSVLLLNDRFDPNWKVTVDGKPDTLLRCNYIMRGVYLPPGAHTVEFRFLPPVGPLYVSLAAMGVGLLLLGFVLVTARQSGRPASPRAPASAWIAPLASSTAT
ncbi:MAG: hypothetical protein ACLQU3_10390 [Limisphaerales bacterium]